MKKIIIATAILATSGFVGHNAYMNYQVESKISGMINKFNENETVQMTSDEYGYNFMQEIFLKNVKLTNITSKEEIELGNVFINNIDLENEIPHYLSVDFENISYDIEKELKQNKTKHTINDKEQVMVNILEKASINNKISTSLSFDYKYSPEKNHDFKMNLSQNVENIGNSTFSLNFDSFDFYSLKDKTEQIKEQPMMALGALSTVKFKNISFDFVDDSLTKLILSEIAAGDKKFNSAKDVEDFLIAKIKGKNRKEFHTAYYDEFIKIIENKKGFKLSADFKDLPIMQLFMSFKD